MHPIKINGNLCDKLENGIRPEIMWDYNIQVILRRQDDSHMVQCQIHKWTKSYFSLGHDNSKQLPPLNFMWDQNDLGTCDLSLCVT